MTAFVNDDPKPVLEVEPLLGAEKQGKIGVWGWDSYFSNFQFSPDTPE